MVTEKQAVSVDAYIDEYLMVQRQLAEIQKVLIWRIYIAPWPLLALDSFLRLEPVIRPYWPDAGATVFWMELFSLIP